MESNFYPPEVCSEGLSCCSQHQRWPIDIVLANTTILLTTDRLPLPGKGHGQQTMSRAGSGNSVLSLTTITTSTSSEMLPGHHQERDGTSRWANDVEPSRPDFKLVI
ncbi:uncharacterized protein LOC124255947 [Haliotis rubra]|uniref:uncharacterized protein LOC124255947 n=1 Tax=Haliotis rubra TaxID=36100 RepID=UPI001EE5B471|nr:uncharacterized protein LOC124255947 [Haliotis rubra]